VLSIPDPAKISSATRCASARSFAVSGASRGHALFPVFDPPARRRGGASRGQTLFPVFDLPARRRTWTLLIQAERIPAGNATPVSGRSTDPLDSSDDAF
jgi:hypothetical protein